MYSAPMACSARPRVKAARSAASPWVCSSACSRSTSGTQRRRAAMGELGEIRERGGPEVEQMLPLQIPPRALARDGRDALGAMLRQDRAVAGLPLPHMLGAEAAGDDAHAIAIQIQRARQSDRVGRHRVRMRVMDHHARRARRSRGCAAPGPPARP